MVCRGVLFAITNDLVTALLAARSDEALLAVVEAIAAQGDDEHLAETDRSWDAMHRTLGDGTLDPGGRGDAVGQAILGARQLHRGDDTIVSLVLADEVPEVARALALVDEGEFRERYFAQVPPGYSRDYGEDDVEYTWAYFRGVAELYARAAAAGRAVVFTVDR